MLDDCSEVLLFMACLFPAETPPKRGQCWRQDRRFRAGRGMSASDQSPSAAVNRWVHPQAVTVDTELQMGEADS